MLSLMAELPFTVPVTALLKVYPLLGLRISSAPYFFPASKVSLAESIFKPEPSGSPELKSFS